MRQTVQSYGYTAPAHCLTLEGGIESASEAVSKLAAWNLGLLVGHHLEKVRRLENADVRALTLVVHTPNPFQESIQLSAKAILGIPRQGTHESSTCLGEDIPSVVLVMGRLELGRPLVLQNVVVLDAVIAIGRERHWRARLLWESGVLKAPRR